MEKMSPQEAWNKAAYYLKVASGFPAKSKHRLFKQSQDFEQTSNTHQLVFQLNIDHTKNVRTDKPLSESKETEILFNSDFFERLSEHIKSEMGYGPDKEVKASMVGHHQNEGHEDIFNIRLVICNPRNDDLDEYPKSLIQELLHLNDHS